MELYTNQSDNPKINAQRNLEGRTHYVDDGTLRFHKSRILSTHITDGGLLFALVESYAKDFNGNRAFRPVIFDVFGDVIERPKMKEGYSSSKEARDAMWDILNGLDAFAVTEMAILRQEKAYAREIQYAREDLTKLKEKVA